MNICVSQKNAGVCTAINKGLQYIRGKYLVWPDGDDWYEDENVFFDAITALEQDDKSSCVRFFPKIVDENTGSKRNIYYTGKNKECCIFEDVLLSTSNIWLPAGSHVIRVSTLFKYYKDKKIFSSRFIGQNIQLLLPVTCNSNTKILKGIRYNILERKGSHHRMRKSFNTMLNNLLDAQNMICKTLDCIYDLDKIEKKNLKYKIKERYYTIIMKRSFSSFHIITGFKYYLKKKVLK